MKNKIKYLIRVLGIGILVLLFFSEIHADQIELIYNNTKLPDRKKIDSIYHFYYKESSPVEQLKISNQIISLAESTNDMMWLFRGYYLKGNSYYYMAEPEKAYDSCLKGLEIARKANITEGLDLIYNSIANILSLNKEHDEAIYYYKLASNRFLKNKDSISAGYSFLNIVNEFNNIYNPDSAYFYLEIASSIFAKHNDAYGMAYISGHKALYYEAIGETDLAEQNLTIAIRDLKQVGQIYDILAFEFEMCKILSDKGVLVKAKVKLLDVYEKSLLASFKEQIRDASQLLSEINLKLGDYKNAYYYQSQYIAYKDSITNDETIRKMADLRTEYEISQKQVEIDFLEKKRFASRIALISIMVIAIVLLSLAYLLYTNNKTIKKQSRKLQEQTLALEELNRTKDKMFAIISHDLRSPISSITGYFSFMKELIKTQDTEQLLNFADEMTKSLQNISYLLDNLLNWATNQRGEIPYNPEVFHIHSIFDQLAEVFSNAAKAKGVTIVLNIEEHTQINADKNTFATIFRNLISNAIKYTNAGDKITVTCEELTDKLKISVADTGIGISEKKLPYIFDFDDSKSTWGTANEKGVGLGLRLAHEFTELNKGKIYVESETCVGTTFYIEFPKVK